MGVFRVAWPGGADENNMYVGGGDSWVGVIEFDDTVKAKVLLSYGNATQRVRLTTVINWSYSPKKELRDAWFTDSDVKANTKETEIFSDIEFLKKVVLMAPFFYCLTFRRIH